jgi:hypothetical protein
MSGYLPVSTYPLQLKEYLINNNLPLSEWQVVSRNPAVIGLYGGTGFYRVAGAAIWLMMK